MFALRRFGNLVQNIRMKHTLPDLPYDYKALAPVICEDIMVLHHTKHHAAYVNNLNAAEDKMCDAIAKCDLGAITSLTAAIKFNGGGHINHSIFWKNLTPNSCSPSTELKDAVIRAFDSFENMKCQLSAAACNIQGSGWAWLAFNPSNKCLEIATCANQDPLQPTTGLIPLFGIDVWEHAYYLQYKNARPEYVKGIFDIVNWIDVSRRYSHAISC